MSLKVSFTAWRYSRDTHELEGTLRIHGEPTPIGELVYIVPPLATLLEPPQPPAGYVAVFDHVRQDWHVVADHRGETWFDRAGRPVTIERLGRPIEWGLNQDPMGKLAMG